jgi:hypothetical protein
VNGSIKNLLKYFLKRLLNIFNSIKFNKPLYSFTLPGFILGTSGLYMDFNFAQTLNHGGSFNFEYTILMALLTLVGIIMAFMGVLLHSIAGLIRYKASGL